MAVMTLFSTYFLLENGFLLLCFDQITVTVLDSYFIYRNIIINFRSAVIEGKIPK